MEDTCEPNFATRRPHALQDDPWLRHVRRGTAWRWPPLTAVRDPGRVVAAPMECRRGDEEKGLEERREVREDVGERPTTSRISRQGVCTSLHANRYRKRARFSQVGGTVLHGYRSSRISASPVDLGWEMADARFERTEAVATVVSLGIEKRSTHHHQCLTIPSSQLEKASFSRRRRRLNDRSVNFRRHHCRVTCD